MYEAIQVFYQHETKVTKDLIRHNIFSRPYLLHLCLEISTYLVISRNSV